MKRGSVAEPNEPATSSGASSLRSELRDVAWERGLEDPSLSRNPSQRSSVMAAKERPDSMQLFSKAVFSRRPKLLRGNSGQGPLNSSLLSLTEISTDTTPDLPKEPRFIQSMFARRRTRGESEASMKKIQISGPYDFQHVSHSSKENVRRLDDAKRHEALPGFSGARPRTGTDVTSAPSGLNLRALDKPLPTPPSPEQDMDRASSRGSIQFSPSRFIPDDAQTSPIPPLRTSSRISVHHDRTDSFGRAAFDRLRSNSGHQAQPFILPTTDGLWPPPVSQASGITSGPQVAAGGESSPYPNSATDDNAWPLTGSMSSLPEVPEEEEYHLTNIKSRASIMSNTTSLRGSISVPYLRRVSLNQATQRPPSNASDTLGRFDLLAAQRALHGYDDEGMDDNEFSPDNWEDDIDYCYDHAAEADCDFAWERLSCDLDHEAYPAKGSYLSHRPELSVGSFGSVRVNQLSADVPGLGPTSYVSGATLQGAITPTGSAAPMTSNFSLPRIDTSAQLKREHDRSGSTASSFQEADEFCLSPSLLIPNDYHECVLQYERGDLGSHDSSDELQIPQHDDHHLKFDKPADLLHTRSSASTTVSTLSDRSLASSRYPSSTFTRWTGSSSSSWQAHADSPQPVTITVNDKEAVITPATDLDVAVSSEPAMAPAKPEGPRESHSRAQSEANVLGKMAYDPIAPLDSKVVKDPLKTHRRVRTASRSHANLSPQFALFPQVPRRT